jgi:hypothetical protein
MKPFNLEAFKQGQKALTRDGRVATFIGVCEDCRADEQLIYTLKELTYAFIVTTTLTGMYGYGDDELDFDLVSMASRHRHLINTRDWDDTYLMSTDSGWMMINEPSWSESIDYKLHPHNDLIKAHKKGAKIESYIVGEWIEEPTINWYADTQYRIKPEPTTKTIYEWMFNDAVNWNISDHLRTEEDAQKAFGLFKYKKTGRSWEVDV